MYDLLPLCWGRSGVPCDKMYDLCEVVVAVNFQGSLKVCCKFVVKLAVNFQGSLKVYFKFVAKLAVNFQGSLKVCCQLGNKLAVTFNPFLFKPRKPTGNFRKCDKLTPNLLNQLRRISQNSKSYTPNTSALLAPPPPPLLPPPRPPGPPPHQRQNPKTTNTASNPKALYGTNRSILKP